MERAADKTNCNFSQAICGFKNSPQLNARFSGKRKYDNHNKI